MVSLWFPRNPLLCSRHLLYDQTQKTATDDDGYGRWRVKLSCRLRYWLPTAQSSLRPGGILTANANGLSTANANGLPTAAGRLLI